MEFRRIDRFPPYVFSIVNELKMEARRAGEDIIDLGMGNPDIPTPEAVVDKLKEAADNPRNHRYSASKGIPKLRRAICDLYERNWGVQLDPDTEAVATIGAKEGLSHLAWVLLEPGDSVMVPEPTYPIHTYSMILAGASTIIVGIERTSNWSMTCGCRSMSMDRGPSANSPMRPASSARDSGSGSTSRSNGS